MSEFDTATAVAADGSGAIHPRWDIGGNANGGYLLALAASRMRDVAGRPDPVTVTAHYLAPGLAGPVQIDAETIKAGKRFTTMSATMRRGDRPLLRVLGTFGDLADVAGPDHVARADHVTFGPPELPAMAECIPRTPYQGGLEVPMMERLDVRLRPADAGFAGGLRSGVAEMAGWFAFADGRPVDTLALLLVCDALPPAVFNIDLPAGWVPTMEFTVHVRARPAPGPVRCVFRSRAVSGGFLEEDGEVWDSADRLVAMSRQLALVPR